MRRRIISPLYLNTSASTSPLHSWMHVVVIADSTVVFYHGCAKSKSAGRRVRLVEGLEKGGNGGPLLTPGDGESGLLIQRLTTENEEHRMPLGKEPLSEKEIMGIATWISEGAQFNGDKKAIMSALAKSSVPAKSSTTPKKPVPAKSKAGKEPDAKESGKETVHFMKDIMPELVDTCGRCHTHTRINRHLTSNEQSPNTMSSRSSPATSTCPLDSHTRYGTNKPGLAIRSRQTWTAL